MKSVLFAGTGRNLTIWARGGYLIWSTSFLIGSVLREASQALQVNIFSPNVAKFLCLIFNLALALLNLLLIECRLILITIPRKYVLLSHFTYEENEAWDVSFIHSVNICWGPTTAFSSMGIASGLSKSAFIGAKTWLRWVKERIKNFFGNSDYCPGQYLKEFCVKVKRSMELYL